MFRAFFENFDELKPYIAQHFLNLIPKHFDHSWNMLFLDFNVLQNTVDSALYIL